MLVTTLVYKMDFDTSTRFGVKKGGVGMNGIMRTKASTMGTVALSSTSMTTVDGRCVR